MEFSAGHLGDVDLSGVKCAAIVAWPKAIHEGNGKAVFIVDPSTTDAQVQALGQILSGDLGGMPWELLGPTMQVIGMQKVPITIEGEGRRSTFRAEGMANIDLPDGFIWKRGECGQGSFHASSDGLSVSGENTNWIFYEFDWSNA
jgi:hypothetical protein